MTMCKPECVRPRIGSRLEHCKVCHQTFASTVAGDSHRTGSHGVRSGPDARRCRSAEEMVSVGLWADTRGIWHGRASRTGIPKRWSARGSTEGPDSAGLGAGK